MAKSSKQVVGASRIPPTIEGTSVAERMQRPSRFIGTQPAGGGSLSDAVQKIQYLNITNPGVLVAPALFQPTASSNSRIPLTIEGTSEAERMQRPSRFIGTQPAGGGSLSDAVGTIQYLNITNPGVLVAPALFQPTASSNLNSLSTAQTAETNRYNGRSISSNESSKAQPGSLNAEMLSSRTTPIPEDKHSSTASSSEEAKTIASSSSSDNCRLVYVQQDEANLSPYQCLLRQQIEIFEATEADLNGKSQGRNRPIVLKQVGIRCRHCGRKPTRERAKGAVYFPSRLVSLYQTGQNMASKHFIQDCRDLPQSVREDLIRVQVREKGKKGTKTRKSAYGGGRNYWADCLRLLGVVETNDRRLRFSPSQGADDGKCTTSDP